MQLPATWDAIASGYAAETEARFMQFLPPCVDLAALARESRVLDVATGPGSLAFAVAPRVAHVTAVDFSPGMIAELEKRVQREGVTNIETAVMDAQALGFADASFDAAFCLFSFFFFPDRPKAFAEMRRVLRPGGRAVIATWGPIDRRPITKIGFDAIAEAIPDLPRMAKGDLQSTEECVREMTEAGFRDVTARTFSSTAHFESADRYFEMMERSMAPIALLQKLVGKEGWLALRPKVLEAVRKRLPDGPADLAAEAILTVGTR